MDKISQHISYREATFSPTAVRLGIDNVPNEKQLENMKMWAENVFEPIREAVSKKLGVDTPLVLNSFFRCVKLNKAIKGSGTSSHCAGEETQIEEAAGDVEINCPDFTNKDLFILIKEKGAFDQLIFEFNDPKDPSQPAWVHVGFRKYNNRMQVLKAIKEKGITKYVPFI